MQQEANDPALFSDTLVFEAFIFLRQDYGYPTYCLVVVSSLTPPPGLC